MHEHRLASSRSLEVFRFDDTFSIFHFLDERGLTSVSSVHRCFSLARTAAGEEKTLVWEELDTKGEGIIEEENLALNRCFHDYTCHSVSRVSFWQGVLTRFAWPEMFWVSEVSLPQLFPANEAKLGEILLDATRQPDKVGQTHEFLFARLPGYWFFSCQYDVEDEFSVTSIPYKTSEIQSHIRSFKDFGVSIG
ncbi:MAG: hypothetical protein IJJ33_10775 [Victivallales bacterium]|nr:hypothetical protein [Victivallales bacterium]